jgi:DnaD/phage-associated family protein
VKVFSNNIHPITTLEYQKMQDWLNEIEAAAIIFAIEEAVLQSKRTMSYIEGILKSYVKAGIKTRAQAEAQKRDWIDRKNQGSKSGVAKDNSKNQTTGSNIKSFNNFINRTYDAKALEETLLNKTKNELLVGDEEFEQIMAERRARSELNNISG